jgi:hypothetical protein
MVEMLEGQLNRFIMYDDEMPHEMFNGLKKLVNKARALGSKKWTDRMLTERLMMGYTPMSYNIVALIRQDSAYKKMTSDDVLGRTWTMRWTFKKQTTLRISIRASQHSRSKTLLSKQTRARRRKFWLRALVRKKKKRNEKTMKENMMNMKWLY